MARAGRWATSLVSIAFAAILRAGCVSSAAEEASTCANPLIGQPSTGFVLADLILPGEHISSVKALRIEEAVEAPKTCSALVFENAPEVLGDLEFKAVQGQTAHGRPYFSNGRYFLSFILPVDNRPFGTWILGDSPGEDRGIGFVVAPHPHIVPCFEAAEDRPLWKWINDDAHWVDTPQTSVTCLGTSPGVLLLDASYIMEESLQSIIIAVSDDSAAYIGADDSEWRDIQLRQVPSVPYGVPALVADGKGRGQCQGTMVNAEFLYTSWRLMFHCHSNGQTEVFVDFTDQGFSEGSDVSVLTIEALQIHQLQQRGALSTASPGDFFWVFYRRLGGGMHTTRVVTVECLSSEGATVLFKYYPDDRREVMRRSLLSYMEDLLIVHVNHSIILGELEVEVTSALPLGDDAVLWIRDYLMRHEGRFGGLSSCFLYHAAIAMPAPFIYAAEIVCVLIGSKPIVMIQVSSSSDHQLKFPLVAFLAQKIIILVKQNPDFPLGYFKSSYRSEETLVIYHKNQSQHADLLLPYRQAQALHIVPYPEESPADPLDNDPILKAQIYNSWWNGYILGYPERFIDSYCRDFHSKVGADDKTQLMKSAKADVIEILAGNNLTVAEICLGLNADVGGDFWMSLRKSDRVGC